MRQVSAEQLVPKTVAPEPGLVPDDATLTCRAGFEAGSSVTQWVPGPWVSGAASSPAAPEGHGRGLFFDAWHFFSEPSREGRVGEGADRKT